MIKMGMRKKIRGLKPNEIKALNRGTIRLFELIKDLIDDPLTMDDFEVAIGKIGKSVGQGDLVKLEVWMKDFGST